MIKKSWGLLMYTMAHGPSFRWVRKLNKKKILAFKLTPYPLRTVHKNAA